MTKAPREILNVILIVLGVLFAGMGIKGFLLSSHFIDGGVTGICMLIAASTGTSLAVLLPLINLPFVALGYRQMGAAFAVRSAIAIGALALAVATIPYPDVTHDRLLTAVFGGFFLGAGIGLTMRGGAVLDGTEIAALLISRRSGAFKVGDVILGFNAVLFVAAMRLLGVEEALYSILTYVSAAWTLDFVLHGIENFTAITIMSDSSSAIRDAITNSIHRGVTVFKGQGGMSGADREILFCVVTRLEIGRVKTLALDIDPQAFIVTQPLSEVHGGRLKRPRMVH